MLTGAILMGADLRGADLSEAELIGAKLWNSKLNDASLENGLSVSAPAYLEVRPVTRLVYTFMTEGQPGDQLTATVDLKEADGTTLLILTNLCVSKEARDAMVNSGAAAGAKMAWDRLAELLAEA